MSQATLTPMPAALHRFLRSASRRVLLFAIARCLLMGGAILVGAGLGMLLLDAALALPTSVRIALNLLFVLAIAFMGWRLWVVLRNGRFEPRRTAVQVEQRLTITDSRLINAVDLALDSTGAEPSSLCQSVIASGEQLAKTLNPADASNPKTLVPAAKWLAITALLAGLVYLIAPGIYRAGLQRYFSPSASYPAFTLLKFEVDVTPDIILFGQSAHVRVVITGPNIPQHATLVFVDEADQDAQHLPMVQTWQSQLEGAKDYTVSQTFYMDLSRLEESARFYIDTPTGRSALYTINVIPVPQFDRISIRYRFPEYTGWQASEHRLNAAGLRALVGTQATIVVTSNVPLSGGEFLITPSDAGAEQVAIALVPRADDPRVAIGLFTMTQAGEYAITLSAYDGTPSTEAIAGFVTALEDEPPRVSISEPPMTVLVPEGYSLPVRIRARDDVGISRMALSFSLNDGPSIVQELAIETQRESRAVAEAMYTFDLETMGLSAGDEVTYIAIAHDNRGAAFGGSQSTESSLHSFHVISREEYLERERQNYRIGDLAQEFDAVLARLAELEAMRDEIVAQMQPLLDKIANGEALTPEDQLRLAALTEALADFEQLIAQLQSELEARLVMPQLYEFEQPYVEKLQAITDQLETQREQAAQLRDGAQALSQAPQSGPDRQRFAEDAAAFLEDDGTPFDDKPQQQRELTQAQLQQLAMVDRMMEQVERFKQTIEDERHLEEALSVFENNEALTLAEQLQAGQLAQEQAALRQEMVDALRQLGLLTDKAKDILPQMSASAQQLIAQVESLGITADMKEVQQRGMAGEGQAAHRWALLAADKLESLLQQAPQGMSQSGDPQLDGPIQLTDAQMSSAMEQMAQGRPAASQAQSQSPSEQPGTPQDGTGQGGNNAPIAVRGPAGRPDLNGQRGNTGTPGSRPGDNTSISEVDHNPESLEVQTNQATSADGIYVLGVPQRYRDEAEAYFRRLTEDSR